MISQPIKGYFVKIIDVHTISCNYQTNFPGKPIKINIDHCLANLCFEKEVPYEEPMEQLQALIDSSSKCTQDIIMLCLLAPIKVQLILTRISV